MRRLIGTALAALAPSAFMVASSLGAVAVPSGDTCAANGSGTTYTLVVTVPGNAPEQGGFAIGAPGGVTVTNVTVSGASGSPVTQNLPANTTAGWFGTTSAVPGSSITMAVTTSAAVSGSFNVVPTNSTHTTYFDPLPCALSTVTPAPSNKFTVQRPFTYSAGNGSWHSFVAVPGPGRLIFNHRTVAAKGTPRALIYGGKISVTKAGKVALTLRPTAAGKRQLAKTGLIRLDLSVEFSPRDGKPGNKVMSLTLKK